MYTSGWFGLSAGELTRVSSVLRGLQLERFVFWLLRALLYVSEPPIGLC